MEIDISRVTIDGVTYVAQETMVLNIGIAILIIAAVLMWFFMVYLLNEHKKYKAFIRYKQLNQSFDRYLEYRKKINGD